MMNISPKLRKKEITFGLSLAIVAMLALLGWLVIPKSLPDYAPNSAGPKVVLSVAGGEFGSVIAQDAQKLGVVKSAKKLISLLNAHANKFISPGDHLISTHIPAQEALTELLDQKNIENSITFIPGQRFSQFWSSLNNSKNITGKLSESDLVAALAQELPLPNSANSPEGEIGLATYNFPAKTTEQDAAREALANFAKQQLPTLKPLSLVIGQKKLKLSAYQVLIVASLIQIEGDPKDFAKVSGVIYHRLAIDMPLQLNSTVAYALNISHQISLSDASTHISSPYNTYRNIGLPPTPIDTPSQAAISAAQNPQLGPWLYFITVKPGDTRFSVNYQDFLKNKALYEKSLAAGLFK
jgi:UPF0755 protein